MLVIAILWGCTGAGEDTGSVTATGPDDACDVVDPYPSLILDNDWQAERFGTLDFQARDGNMLRAFTFRSSGFEPATGPILFVMHGSGRTAESYLEAMIPVAERVGAVAIAPEFPETLYPDSDDYTLGVGTGVVPDGGVYDPDEWRAPSDYVFSELEHLFEGIKDQLGSQVCRYHAFGHSAGSQFLQRLVLFLPHARVERVAAANAGWYTLPDWGDFDDENTHVPYGLQGSPVNATDLQAGLGQGLIVMVGELDTATSEEDSEVRGSDEAEAQGAHRLARGEFHVAAGRAQADALGVTLGWSLQVVPQAGHSKDHVASTAGWALFRGPDESWSDGCEPSEAADAGALVLNELHADPAPDLSGDANGDGRLDGSEDEFLELYNGGSDPLCLAGWTISDVARSGVATLLPGTELPAGGTLVLFGGGAALGDFGDAQVDWGGRLSLSGEGDVVTLRDAAGATVLQASWGDCEGVACAASHYAENLLDVGTSLTRSPELTGEWVLHSSVAEALYSPGTRADGTGL